ncbi:sulfurtransferase TusA family protein [Rhodospirillaceae bacterium KN72]|uniref:Sulfurtransferase TusA family protein n=1 Tax=Pacificispira spongiicola TaxID=2729598 RepID=A0A7Y0E1H7_9PROT|nr:sulfurtransferase TusA family protein [Pacificispira spongiicola]NMM44716.1 sulfurtransferase TusA family protein [Pacificispira spongiicola]
MAETELDATGLKCPLPVLKARRALNRLQAGDILRVSATDPGSPADMRAFCEGQGHILHSSTERDGVFRYEIEKRDDPSLGDLD